MISDATGTATLVPESEVEVMAATPRGIWLWLRGREYFLATADFPWFADAPVRAVYNVELHRGHVLHWPALDIDLDTDVLDHPERWPLKAKALP